MRLVGYIRVSTVQQANDSISLQIQTQHIQQYAMLYEHSIESIFSDVASGKTCGRSGFQQALAILTNCDGLIVATLDRLTRSVKDLCWLLDKYFQDKKLISIAEQFDTSTAYGRLVLNMLTIIAQWEREAVSENTSTSLQYLKANGVTLGNLPYGTKRLPEKDENKRFIVAAATEELQIIEKIIAMRNAGMKFREIAVALAEAGIATKKHKTWHPATIQRIVARALHGSNREPPQ